MKYFLPILFFSIEISIASAQNIDIEKISDSLITEGKRLYRSEMASWYGTDIFLDKFKDKRSNSGGYFSYADKELTRCIFFSKGENPVVIASFTFDSTYNVNTAFVDGSERQFTPEEITLYSIRKIALSEIRKDTLFKVYKNSNLNLVPLVDGDDKKVYVFTGPESNGIVIFGNDYLLNFDSSKNIISKKQLHKNIIVVNYGKQDDQNIIGTMHTHLPETGDFITATDICTLLLYEKFAKWNQHYVMSKNYISIWDCNKNILTIITREAWDKIYKKND